MRKLKQISTIAAAVAIAAALTGCGGTSGTEPSSAISSVEQTIVPTGMTVGISLPSEANSIWSREGEYLREHFAEQGYETDLSFASDSAEQQRQDLSRMIEEGCSLLIVAPVTASGYEETLTAAAEAKIPVLSLGSLIMDSGAVSCLVQGDDFRIGQLEGQAVIEGLQLKTDGKSYQMEFTAGDPDDASSGLIFNGMYDVLETFIAAGTLNIASGEGTFTQSSAGAGEASEERIAGILQNTYRDGTKLHAIAGGTDAEAGGAAKALESYSGNNVILCGRGADDEALARILDGTQTMTVFTPVYEEAVAAVDIGISLMTEEATDSYVIETSSWSFECRYDTASYSNNYGIVPAFLIEPQAVTKDNYKELLVDTGYFVMNGKYPVSAGG